MAKKKMKLKGISNFILMLVGVIGLVGIGALFLEGTFLNVIILNWLPKLIHDAVGWIMIVGALFSGVVSILKIK